MKTNIINIGNSQGVILPSILLKQLKLANKAIVDITISNGTIVIEPEPRQGWAAAAKKLSNTENDNKSLSDFEENEWTW